MILSFDDFHEGCPRYDLLFELKNKVSQLRVNLFTILGKCSPDWIKEIKNIPWIDMIPHGWLHDGPECEFWTKQEALECLDKIEPLELTKGFKAPGYRISNATYDALLERNYWVGDIIRHQERWPHGLRVYLNNNPRRIQGHMGALVDGLEERFDYYASLTGDFLFIKDII